MGLIDRIFGRSRESIAAPLYAAIVARGRDPHWFVEGAVPDTIDGRFDMIAAVLCQVLLRLERDDAPPELGVALTECFIDDMDAQLRQEGIGDVGLGKQIGKMVSALGGRLAAYRDGLAAGDLRTALIRNLYRGTPPGDAAVDHVNAALLGFATALSAATPAALKEGRLP